MAGKIDYKTAVLSYLKDHPNENVTRDTLISKTNVSKSRLSEVLQSIRDDGYVISSPPRSGIIKLEIDEESNALPLPTIKDYDVRQWLILFLLSKYNKLTFRELLLKTMSLKDWSYDQVKLLMDPETTKKSYDNSDLIKSIRKNTSYNDDEFLVAKDVVSVTALRNDLTELRENGLVTMKKADHTTYQLSSKAPLIITLSDDSLFEFCQKYEETVSTTSDIEPLKQAYNKIKELINLEGEDTNRHRFGKSNDISKKQIDTFNAFISHPYKTHLLKLTNIYQGKTQIDTFAVGLLFYSVETGSFYALGKNITEKRIESRRLDWIDKIETTTEANNEFQNKRYYKIYEEMFSAQYEEKAYPVKVYFQEFGNVAKRFYDLSSVRSLSSIRLIDNPPEDCPYKYIYEDTIRGLSDFARYLRGFGISVLAAEPEQLQEKMLFTYNRILEKYEVTND